MHIIYLLFVIYFRDRLGHCTVTAYRDVLFLNSSNPLIFNNPGLLAIANLQQPNVSANLGRFISGITNGLGLTLLTPCIIQINEDSNLSAQNIRTFNESFFNDQLFGVIVGFRVLKGKVVQALTLKFTENNDIGLQVMGESVTQLFNLLESQ